MYHHRTQLNMCSPSQGASSKHNVLYYYHNWCGSSNPCMHLLSFNQRISHSAWGSRTKEAMGQEVPGAFDLDGGHNVRWHGNHLTREPCCPLSPLPSDGDGLLCPCYKGPQWKLFSWLLGWEWLLLYIILNRLPGRPSLVSSLQFRITRTLTLLLTYAIDSSSIYYLEVQVGHLLL